MTETYESTHDDGILNFPINCHLLLKYVTDSIKISLSLLLVNWIIIFRLICTDEWLFCLNHILIISVVNSYGVSMTYAN